MTFTDHNHDPLTISVTISTIFKTFTNSKILTTLVLYIIIVPSANTGTYQQEMDNTATWAAANNLKLNVSKSKEIIFQDSRRRTAVTSPQPLPNILCEKVLKCNHHKPPVGVRTWQHAIAVRASHTAAPRHDWDRPIGRLPSSSRAVADVRITRGKWLHHGDGPPTRKRISQTQQAMQLLRTWPARLQQTVREGRHQLSERTLNNPYHTLPQLLTPQSAASQKYNLRCCTHDRTHQGHLSD